MLFYTQSSNNALCCGHHPMLRARCVTVLVCGVGSVVNIVWCVVGVLACMVWSFSINSSV